MRSASERWAIEKIAMRGFPAGVRSQQVVEAHREREALLRRKERLEIHDADLRDRWRLDPRDQGGEVEVFPFPPGRRQNRRDQDVLAALERIGVHAGQSEQTRRRRGHALAQRFLVDALSMRFARRGGERLQDRDRQPRGGAGRVDRELRGLPEPPDPLAVLAPLGEPVSPELGLLPRVLVRRHVLARGVVLVDPRPEVGRRELRERQEEIAEVPLRIDEDRRHAVDGGLLDQGETQSGLPAARHADADGVRDQVARVVEDELLAPFLGRELECAAEVEDPELLEVPHGPMIWETGGTEAQPAFGFRAPSSTQCARTRRMR
jgi:hypothetical protein